MTAFFFRAVFPLAAVLLCFTISPASAQWDWCWGQDDVHAEVIESTIRVHHDATLYSCCPEWFEYTVSQQGNVIGIEEVEFGGGCTCLCCYDLAVDVEEVPSGDYIVDFRWFEYETGEWRSVQMNVTVPDLGQVGPLALGPSTASDCLTVGIPDPEPIAPSTWSKIKAVYR